MSSGFFRKQYEALSLLADQLSVVYSTPTGSFNEKFCELCRLIIVDQGGSFVPNIGSFTTRKASYLYQLATALGASPVPGSSMRATMLLAAKAIYDAGNDGELPTTGASQDWRTYQYLIHAIVAAFDPSSLDPAQWLDDVESPSTILDKSAYLRDALAVDSPAGKFDGVGDEIDCSDGSGNAWLTQDPFVDVLIKPDNLIDGNNRYNIVSRVVGNGGGITEWELFKQLASFRFIITGATTTVSLIAPNISATAWHRVQAFVDRAGNQTVLRYRETVVGDLPPNPWTTITGALPEGAIGQNCVSRIGGDTWYNVGWLPCTIADVKISNYATGDTISAYSGLTSDGKWIDREGTADGLVSTGAGGLPTFESGRQSNHHAQLLDGYTLYEHATLDPIYVDYDTSLNPIARFVPPAGYTKTYDVAGAPALGVEWNGAPTSLIQDAANPQFLDNPLYSDDGINYVARTGAERLAHPSFLYNTVIKSHTIDGGPCVIDEEFNWLQDYEWTPTNYENMLGYIAGSCGADPLVPMEKIEGGYALDIDGNIVFTTP